MLMQGQSVETEYLVKNGKRTAVIVPIEEYEELLQDLDDLAVIARRKNSPRFRWQNQTRRRVRHSAGVMIGIPS